MRVGHWRGLALAAALASVAGGAHPQTDAPASVTRIALDGEQTIGGVGFACTGIGQEKDDPRWASYPIRLEFSNTAGDLLANVAVRLSTRSGQLIGDVQCEGPWILLRPPPGTYKADAWMPHLDFPHRTAIFSPPAHGLKIVELRFPEG